MTTKTKLPDGMAELLDRIGVDTETARFCLAGDYAAALVWLKRTIRPHEWNPDTKVGGATAMGIQQTETNRARAEAYVSLVAMLEGLADG